MGTTISPWKFYYYWKIISEKTPKVAAAHQTEAVMSTKLVHLSLFEVHTIIFMIRKQSASATISERNCPLIQMSCGSDCTSPYTTDYHRTRWHDVKSSVASSCCVVRSRMWRLHLCGLCNGMWRLPISMLIAEPSIFPRYAAKYLACNSDIVNELYMYVHNIIFSYFWEILVKPYYIVAEY